jgi:hypothetical protein
MDSNSLGSSRVRATRRCRLSIRRTCSSGTKPASSAAARRRGRCPARKDRCCRGRNQPPSPPPGFNCCIGSPIDDRQYSMAKSFGTPWVSSSLPSMVGSGGALFVVTYVDFLEEVLEADPDRGQQELERYGAASMKANSGPPAGLHRAAAARPSQPRRRPRGLGFASQLYRLAEQQSDNRFP